MFSVREPLGKHAIQEIFETVKTKISAVGLFWGMIRVGGRYALLYRRHHTWTSGGIRPQAKAVFRIVIPFRENNWRSRNLPLMCGNSI